MVSAVWIALERKLLALVKSRVKSMSHLVHSRTANQEPAGLFDTTLDSDYNSKVSVPRAWWNPAEPDRRKDPQKLPSRNKKYEAEQ